MPKGDNRRTSFLYPYPVYAEKYGVSEQAIGRMKRSGVNLDDEAATNEWIKTRGRGSVRTKSLVSIPDSCNGDHPPGEVALHGFEAIRSAAADLSNQYRAAHASGDPKELRIFRQWMAAEKQLCESERARAELDLLRGEVVKSERVIMFHSSIFSAIREAIDAAPQRAVYKLIGKDMAGMLEVLRAENEIIFKNIRALPTRLNEL